MDIDVPGGWREEESTIVTRFRMAMTRVSMSGEEVAVRRISRMRSRRLVALVSIWLPEGIVIQIEARAVSKPNDFVGGVWLYSWKWKTHK